LGVVTSTNGGGVPLMDFWVILAFIAGFVACFAFFRASEWNAMRIIDRRNAFKGTQAKQDQAERLMSFMLEVKQGYDKAKEGGKDVKAFAMQDLPAIALKYPDVVLKFGTRLYKMMQSGEGIEGLLEGGLSGLRG